MKKEIYLSVDTAINHGSFSVWKNDEMVHSEIGSNNQARSQYILEIIKDICYNIGFKVNELDGIVFTKGPGSYTGLRVGIASVLGLGLAIGAKLHSVSVFEAYTTLREDYSICISSKVISKDKILIKEFNFEENSYKSSKIAIIHPKELIEKVNISEHICLITDKKSFYLLRELFHIELEREEALRLASDNVSILSYRFFKTNKEVMNYDFTPIYGN